MERPVVHYISDALCGWCYGFGPVMQQLQQAYADKLFFNVVSGGMILGERIKPVSEMTEFIKEAMPRVQETTGIAFGEAYEKEILAKGTYVSNSLPPAVALAVLKNVAPAQCVALAHAIQQAHFLYGQDLNESDTYLPIARAIGLDEDTFLDNFAGNTFKDQVENEFQVVQQWGIQAFPAVVLQKANKLFLVSQGYLPFEQLQQAMEKVLELANQPEDPNQPQQA